MANGDEWGTINEIRRDVSSIKADGCAHRVRHEQDMRDIWGDLKDAKTESDIAKRDIWKTIDREREAREGMVKQIVIGVLITVVAGVVLNMAVMAFMLPKILGH